MLCGVSNTFHLQLNIHNCGNRVIWSDISVIRYNSCLILYDFTVFSSEKIMTASAESQIIPVAKNLRHLKKFQTPRKSKLTEKSQISKNRFWAHIHHFCKEIVLCRTILEIFIPKNQNPRKLNYCQTPVFSLLLSVFYTANKIMCSKHLPHFHPK